MFIYVQYGLYRRIPTFINVKKLLKKILFWLIIVKNIGKATG